jgi:hypothetical protein
MPHTDVILVLRLALVGLVCLWVVGGLIKAGEGLVLAVGFFLVGMLALGLLTLTALKPAWLLPFFLRGLE